PFPYESAVPNPSAWEVGFRAARIERTMPSFLQRFDAIWDERKWELELGLHHFETYDFQGKSLEDIGQYLADARSFHRGGLERPLPGRATLSSTSLHPSPPAA